LVGRFLRADFTLQLGDQIFEISGLFAELGGALALRAERLRGVG
jgi:hypothetical protein